MQNSGEIKKGNLSGYIIVIASAVLFGIMPLFTKAVYAAGGNAITAVFLRYLFASLVLVAAALVKKLPFALRGKQLRDVLVVSMFGYGSTAFLLYSAYAFIPTGLATMIHFVYPALVILAGLVFFKDKPGLTQILSLLLGLEGVMLCFNSSSMGSIWGIGLAFLSGVTYAYYILAVARSTLRELHPVLLLFYLNLFGAGLSFILQGLLGGVVWRMAPSGWWAALGLGLVISIGAVFLFQSGIKRVGPSSAALLSTFEPLTSILVGVLFFQEQLSGRSLLGCALILLSVILLTAGSGRARISAK